MVVSAPANNFDMLRLVAALLVFGSHAFALYGLAEPHLLAGYGAALPVSISTVGVTIFFTISGFLITKSWMQTAVPLDFVVKRLLRIYPAMLVNALVVIAVLAPLSTSVPFGTYVAGVVRDIPELVVRIVLFQGIALPGMFEHHPVPHVINGSLWTLPFETMCYTAVLICGLTRKMRYVVPAVAIGYVFYFWPQLTASQTLVQLAALHGAAFLLGAMYYMYQAWVPLRAVGAAVCAVGLAVMSVLQLYCLPLYVLLAAYLTLYVALGVQPFAAALTCRGDFSYGIYIYAWPVQQMVGQWFGFVPSAFGGYVVASAVLTGALAVASWHWVEAPALKLKQRWRQFLIRKG